MLEIFNRYCHGYVAVPVMLSCRNHGLFTLLGDNQPRSLEQITKSLAANSGHLQAAFRLLESLGWLNRGPDATYRLTAAAQAHVEIPSDVVDLLSVVTGELVLHDRPAGRLRKYVLRSVSRWSISVPLLADFLDGLL